ncbi:MAG: response regulator [Cyanobacteria bacterium P01_D01_bin.44]
MDPTSSLTPVETRKPKKPRMLVVDDEPDNLDLLYRTFRREYKVLRAASGVEALEVLAAEGEVAVIISDQRMPEMKGTEFLSKTVPTFPDTVRIILTGFTDVEDLVEAINAGQVYRYITKPWDPEELRNVVQRATETYDLLKQRNEELHQAEKQIKLSMTVAQAAMQQLSSADIRQFLTDGFKQILGADVSALATLNEGVIEAVTLTGDLPDASTLLTQSSVVQQAITTQTLQSANTASAEPSLSQEALYQAAETQSHVVVPILYQGDLTAILSFQWSNTHHFIQNVRQTMTLLGAQVALALASLRS